MYRTTRVALAAIWVTAFSLQGWSQQEILSPSQNEPGYTSRKTADDSQPAPQGYEGARRRLRTLGLETRRRLRAGASLPTSHWEEP
jgi:hypothetical protein